MIMTNMRFIGDFLGLYDGALLPPAFWRFGIVIFHVTAGFERENRYANDGDPEFHPHISDARHFQFERLADAPKFAACHIRRARPHRPAGDNVDKYFLQKAGRFYG